MSERPLHIGLLATAYAGQTPAGSGIGVHFRHLAEGLCEAGHAVSVVFPASSPPSAPDGLQAGKPRLCPVFQPAPPVARLLGRLDWQLHQWCCERARMRALAAAAARLRPDIWEATSTGTPSLFFRPPVPLVIRVSTTAAQLRAENAGARTWIARRHEAWEAAAVRRASRAVTHSPGHRDAIAAAFGLGEESIPVIPHAVSLPPAAPRREGPVRRILYVGRLEHRKGADLLLAALGVVLAAEPGVTATLVGHDQDNHWRRRWRETRPAALAGRVRFAGVIGDDDLARRYAEADLLLAPSRYESFGLMFAEAMAWGLPVVALRAPGAVDLIEDGVTGLLPPPGDAVALAAAVLSLVRDGNRARVMGAAGRARCEARYSVSSLVGASVALYRRMIASPA